MPTRLAAEFPGDGTHLERYAARLNCAEINSSFYRPHRRATYERWAAAVPADFRFAVKLPKAITHEARLVGGGEALARFAGEIAGLGDRRGPVLVQLPPSLLFDAEMAGAFFGEVREVLGGPVACEPRHASWFTDEADALLVRHHVARVAADPAAVPDAAVPGGWAGLRYARWHGSPRIYWSDYPHEAIERHAEVMQAAVGESWTIYDNTAGGCALANALTLVDVLSGRAETR